MSVHEHQEHGRRFSAVRCAVLTVSDSRSVETDESGRLARQLLTAAGHAVEAHVIVPNEPAEVRREAEGLVEEGVQFILTVGGTGVSERDRTIEAVEPLLARPLPGFGEMFRRLSYDEIGAAAMLTRATLGFTRDASVIACVPGSTAAVRLALEKVIIPQLGHLIHELTK